MFKRFGLLTATLAGALALLQPVAAQARDWDDRRDNRREFRQEERRDHGWQERQRFERYESQRRVPVNRWRCR